MAAKFFKQEFGDGHFYSPYPSMEDVKRNAVRPGVARAASVPFVDPCPEQQWKIWDAFSLLAGNSYLNDARLMGNARYTPETRMFNRCDAATLHCFMRHFTPRRVIEIGSGFTSFVTLDTREYHGCGPDQFTLIEPNPQRLEQRLKIQDYNFCEILKLPLQEVDLSIFRSLEAGDLLFIDSTHVCKSGSDVLLEFCEILPLLAEGVLVHFHDIFWPFEYPLKWYEQGRAWNETFLLRSLLANSRDYRIVIHPHYLMCADKQRFSANAWGFATSGGSIYLVKEARRS